MTDASVRPPASLLRRAALLAGILAVVAGFLGMHVLAPAPAAAQSHSVHGSHDAGSGLTAAGGCAEKSAAHVDCTPSMAGTSLSAPPRGSAPLAIQSWTAAPEGRASDYAYVPASPTPSDLSISRT